MIGPVQLQNAKPVVTPLKEQTSANLHDETTIKINTHCSEVGMLQCMTGERRDLLFVANCLSYKLASQSLADLTRAKKALRYLKGTLDSLLDDPCDET